ncbi:MAG: zinc-ribbon domain-containing protein [Clostridiaceae bacterium]|nr:zinc-ribbon domain-containing protein [Clostridiaceae bacterium]
MNCPKCQAGNPDGALFCSECGTNLSEFEQSTQEVSEVVADDNSELAGDTPLPVADQVAEPISAEPEVVPVQENKGFSNLDDIDDAAEPIPVAPISPVSQVTEPVSAAVVAAPAVAAAPVNATSQASTIPPSAALPPQKSKKALMKEEIAKLPKEYRPLSTIRVVLYYILVSIPVIGALFVLISAFAAKNKNTKSLSRAILVFFIIGLVLALICVILGYVFVGSDIFELPGDLAASGSVEEMLHVLNDFIESM